MENKSRLKKHVDILQESIWLEETILRNLMLFRLVFPKKLIEFEEEKAI